MKIETNKVVVMTYEVEVEGKIIDKTTDQQPFDYIQGTHMLLPSLEAELEGKEAGDSFTCSVPPEEGYGEYDLKKVFDIPKSAFEFNGQLREDLLVVGKYVPMLNSAEQVCHGMVVDIKEDKVTMDFNPPMAGKVMNFTGKVISVRDATEQELKEGLHGEYLPKPEGGCGHCGGHCGGHCHEGDGEGCGCGGHHGDGEGCGCGNHGDGEGCGCGGHHEDGGCCHGED